MKKLVSLLLILVLSLTFITSCSGEKKEGVHVLPLVDAKLDKYINIAREDYVGIDFERPSYEITDEMILEEVEYLASTFNTRTTVTDRAAELGDVVTVDYEGKIDGERFAGGTASGKELELGNAGFISGFEDGIVGHKTGETFTINATFPDDYRTDDLKGKTAQFEITISKIEAVTRPDFNDEFIAANTVYKTYDEVWDAVEKYLVNYYADLTRSETKSNAFNAVLEKADIKKLHKGEYNRHYDQYVDEYKSIAKENGISLEELATVLLGFDDVDELYEDAKAYADGVTRREMVSVFIAREVGIIETLTKEEFDKYVAEMAEHYDYTEDKVIELLGEENIWSEVLWDKVSDYIVENAVAAE